MRSNVFNPPLSNFFALQLATSPAPKLEFLTADHADELFVWGAHAPRVLVSAARRNELCYYRQKQ